MGYVTREMIDRAKEMDLLTYQNQRGVWHDERI